MAADDPTADLANRVRECQVQILRVVKSSGNLKGTCQRDLKTAADTTLGLFEVLRTRADRTAAEANTEEIRVLKKEFREAKENMAKEMALLRENTEKALARADAEGQKAQHHLRLY